MQLDKNKRYLIIVESPEKSRHITEIFRKEGYNKVVVMATIGHFTKMKNGSGYYNTGIDIGNNFAIDYELDHEKLQNINKLKEQVKAADFVFIASDLDREGEAIAWSCREFLKIPKSKYKRIKYHEITKTAIFKAIEDAGAIDENLVSAAHSRAALDIMVGYRLSEIARKRAKCKSVGRCQTAALRLIVEREEEILNFKPEKYIDLYLKFIKNGVGFKAKYQGTDTKSIKKLDTMDQVNEIIKACNGNDFVIDSVEHKDKNDYPKPPFCTATFQQECASKLGLTVDQSMKCAQKLFESGKISYHRTDDEVMDAEFGASLLSFVQNKYGRKYVAKKIQEGKKDENAQAGHECLRVLDLNLTPEQFAKSSNSDLEARVYKIIYNRTVAAAMSPAVIAVTSYTINNNHHKFSMNSNELVFDGYRKLYAYADENDEEEELIKETFALHEKLQNCSFDPQTKETQPKSRYKEASFVKELKDRGIGRPSTYHTIINTIKSEDRGYAKVEKKCIVPTDLGMQLIDFCRKSFPDFLNVEYTSEMEASLDKIANGQLDYLDFMKSFYDTLEAAARKVDGSTGEVCPKCGKPIVLKKGPYGNFKACSGYPDCKYICSDKQKVENFATKSPEETKTCPKCGKPMKIRKGPYGTFWGCTGYPSCKYLENIKKKD